MLFLKTLNMLVLKSSVQTAIDLQISETESLADEEIGFFDQWFKTRIIQPLLFFKDNKGSFSKALLLEQKVFAAARTESVIEAMN